MSEAPLPESDGKGTLPQPSRDSEEWEEAWGERLRTLAAAMPYPPTPDLAPAVRSRIVPGGGAGRGRRATLRAGWAVAIVAGAILAALLAVPEARAAVVTFFRLGAVRIFTGNVPTPRPLPLATGVAPAGGSTSAATRIPRSTPTLVPSLLALDGRTTLVAARGRVPFAVPVPAYPPGLGEPDYVFVQNLGGPVVILAWADPDQPGRVRLSLHLFGPGTLAEKIQPRIVQETTVNGQRALWTEGPHLLRMTNGEYEERRLVEGNTLIWQVGYVTYRLETDQSLAEAVRTAESLPAAPSP